MEYTVVKDWNDMDFGGSGVQGELVMPLDNLLDKLGKPTLVNSKRIYLRWLLKFEDGTRATIFNDPRDDKDIWCIGGFGYRDKEGNNLSVLRVKELFA